MLVCLSTCSCVRACVCACAFATDAANISRSVCVVVVQAKRQQQQHQQRLQHDDIRRHQLRAAATTTITTTEQQQQQQQHQQKPQQQVQPCSSAFQFSRAATGRWNSWTSATVRCRRCRRKYYATRVPWRSFFSMRITYAICQRSVKLYAYTDTFRSVCVRVCAQCSNLFVFVFRFDIAHILFIIFFLFSALKLKISSLFFLRFFILYFHCTNKHSVGKFSFKKLHKFVCGEI